VIEGYVRVSADELERLLRKCGELPDPDIDWEVEAACQAYWHRMSEQAKVERRQRMRLALDAARGVREAVA
jgi:hypothetical protein